MTFGPLVSGEWLASNLDAVRVVDVRWYLDGRSGRAAYDTGHLPGAVWIDLDADLAAPGSREQGRHPLPTPAQFAAALGRLGIAAGTAVVAYDDAGGSVASRLWWLLHVLGEPAAVLDGGMAAYPGALTTVEPSVVPIEREPRAWPTGRFVSADAVAATAAAVFDARTAERYRHGLDGVDARPGHVPGAHSAPWQDNLGPDGRFRPRRRAARALRTRARHRLLRLRGHGLPRPAGDVAGRHRGHRAVYGLVVAVGRRPVPSHRDLSRQHRPTVYVRVTRSLAWLPRTEPVRT